MATASYEIVLEMASSLPPEDQARLAHNLDQRSVLAQKKHSIVELKGLGKEIWQGTDTIESLRKMRDEWDG